MELVYISYNPVLLGLTGTQGIPAPSYELKTRDTKGTYTGIIRKYN